MKKLLLILFVVFTVLSCKDPVKNSIPDFDKIEIDKKIFASNDSTKPYMQLALSFTYPSAFQNDTLLLSLQKIFIKSFVGEEFINKSPKGAFEAYEKEFTDEALILAQDMGDDLGLYGECFQNVKTEVVDTINSVIVLRTEISSYMGGAHGSHTLMYSNVDLNKVSVLIEKDIFSDYSEDRLSALIKEGLEAEYGDKVHDVLFDLEAVRPNGNFYFEEDGLVYIYNEYEIAPYSSGMIFVTIPYEKINSLLVDEYKQK